MNERIDQVDEQYNSLARDVEMRFALRESLIGYLSSGKLHLKPEFLEYLTSRFALKVPQYYYVLNVSKGEPSHESSSAPIDVKILEDLIESKLDRKNINVDEIESLIKKSMAGLKSNVNLDDLKASLESVIEEKVLSSPSLTFYFRSNS